MSKGTSSHVASCADYDSAEDEEVASTREVASRKMATGVAAREQANVAAKRTTDNQASTSSPLQKHQDLASDSGYSSRTQATSASADSGQSATAPAKPDATDVPGSSSQPQAKQAPSTTSSQRSRGSRNCKDPNCEKCQRARKKKASANSSTQSALPTEPRPPSDRAPSPGTKRSPEKAAPSSATAPAGAAQPRPPLRSASTSRPRPRSGYDAYTDPAAAAAYWQRQGYHFGGNGAGYVTGPGNMIVAERPGMPHRATDTMAYSARRRPTSVIGGPLVSYDSRAGQRLSARRPTQTTNNPGVDSLQEDESDETEESGEYDSPEDQIAAVSAELRRRREIEQKEFEARLRALALEKENDRRRMPPPPPPPPSSSPGQKYSMRMYDPAATKITYGTRNDYDPDGFRNATRRMDNNVLSGGLSQERRLSLASNGDHARASAYSQTASNGARVTIDDPKLAPRRMSNVGSESLSSIKAKCREIEEILAHSIAEVPPTSNIQDNRASIHFHNVFDPELYDRQSRLNQDDKPTLYESRQQQALEYQRQMDRLQNQTRPVESAPLTTKTLRHHTGLPSEAEFLSTSRSNDSNDGSGRISVGHRIQAGPSERSAAGISGDEFKMRIDLTSGFEAEFEGRRLSVNPTGEGSIAELVIGSRRESTSYHGTSKGSVTTESRVGRSASIRDRPARPAEREREREREQERERLQRVEDGARGDDERSTTSASAHPSKRGTRPKRAETYTSGRRGAEEQSESDRAKMGHRRMKTAVDTRYAPVPPSPTSGRSKKSFFG